MMKTTSRNGILHLEAMSKPKKDAWDTMGYHGILWAGVVFSKFSKTFNKFANVDFQQAMMKVSVACTRLNAAVSY